MDVPRQTVSEISTEQIEAAYRQHSDALNRFLVGVLRDGDLVAEVLQTTFLVLMEKGDSVKDFDSVKSWLFRVAFNEAMLLKRHSAMTKRHMEKVAWRIEKVNNPQASPAASMMSRERTEAVKRAIETLSDDQQLIVRKRIYEGLKFREIANSLDMPLGTVLARMHSSLKKLRPFFESDDFLDGSHQN